MKRRKKRLLVVDDHQFLAECINLSVNGVFEPEQINTANSLFDGKALIDQVPYDLALIDICIGNDSGLDLIEYIANTHPDTRIIGMSAYEKRGFHQVAIKKGALGFVAKSQGFNELVEAVTCVMNDEVYVPDQLSMIDRAVSSDQNLLSSLTKKEKETLIHLASGKTKNEIAKNMNIKPKSFNEYRSRLLQKLSMDNDAQLTHLALRTELISL